MNASTDLANPVGIGTSSSHTDARWIGLQLFALSFTSLFLELMLIRWVPAVVRLVAYYANLMLISSFLGLGVGAMLASRRRSWFGCFPLLLSINVVILWYLSTVPFVAGSQTEARFFIGETQLRNYFTLIAVFSLNTLLFVPLGQRIGQLFSQLPRLRAYSWDLGGSLVGTLCFGAFSLLYFSPLIGMGSLMLIYLLLAKRNGRIAAILLFPCVLGCVYLSTSATATWSPYYYITVSREHPPEDNIVEPPPHLKEMVDPPIYLMRVGRDFYQAHGTLDLTRYSQGSPQGVEASLKRLQYLLPYGLAPAHNRVAVMGAGGGMDVEASLLSGATHVDAVEIDPVLVAKSHIFNAGDPLANERVTVHVDDARAYLRRMAGGYDMIVFGFLDSQALFSTMSNVRLDGYIYTVESMRTAFSKLGDNGMLSLSFACPTEWMPRKLEAMIREATGKQPLMYFHDGGLILCAFKGQMPSPIPTSFGPWRHVEFETGSIETPHDDWPYLYLQKRTIPTDYLVVIASLLIASLLVIAAVRGTSIGNNDLHFFFMGVGFLLLQTKSITDCSLYFGATWLVTTIVIAGVLTMVILANFLATRLPRASQWLYGPLLGALLIVHFAPRDAILSTSFATRLMWALFIVPLPIFFAGLIFSTTFRDSLPDPASSFGANLIGATVGGFCEYLSMAVGAHALGYLVMLAYLASFLCQMRPSRKANSLIRGA